MQQLTNYLITCVIEGNAPRCTIHHNHWSVDIDCLRVTASTNCLKVALLGASRQKGTVIPDVFPSPAPTDCGVEASPHRVVMLVPGGLNHAGGIGRWAGYLQESWVRQGLQPPLEIVDTRDTGHAGRALTAYARALLRLCRLRATGQLGTIHANLSKRGSTVRKVIVSYVAALTGMRLVVHLHGSGYDAFYAGLPEFWQHRVAALFRRADRVVVLGQSWADWVISIGVPPERVSILHNGVGRPVRQRRAPGPCRILFLGRLGARKGVPELVDALSSPALSARDWHATLAGDGDIDGTREQIGRAGLTERIALPGWLDTTATAALLAQADILVLPSHAENLPISIIEALAAEVAVIATPVGATPELLQDGVSVLFVPVADVDALATAIARLVDDPALRRSVAAAGHTVFTEHLDIDALAVRLAALHRALLSC